MEILNYSDQASHFENDRELLIEKYSLFHIKMYHFIISHKMSSGDLKYNVNANMEGILSLASDVC